MARSMNRVMLIGVVGRDPEMRHTPSGVPVTSFSVATSRTVHTNTGEAREAVDWFNVIAWRQLAEICRAYLQRGTRVYVEGRLETRSWQEPGQPPQHRTEVVATDLILLDDSPGGPDSHAPHEAHETQEVPQPFEDYPGD